MIDKYHFFITNLDAHTIDLEPFQYSGANITIMRMTDTTSQPLADYGEFLKKTEETEKPETEGDEPAPDNMDPPAEEGDKPEEDEKNEDKADDQKPDEEKEKEEEDGGVFWFNRIFFNRIV